MSRQACELNILNYSPLYCLRPKQEKTHLQDPFHCGNTLEAYSCKKCSFSTHLAAVLKNHIQECHSDRNLFPTQFISHSVKTYNCRYCAFETCCSLKRLKHVTLLCCKQAEDIFLNFQISKEKRFPVKRKKKKILVCKECSYTTRKRYNFQLHTLRKHKPEEEGHWFTCDHCPYKTREKRTLQRHMTSKHTPAECINWFECNFCTYRAKEKRHVTTHTIRKHLSQDEIQWFQCEKCSYKAKMRSDLKKHIKSVHTVKKKKFGV